MNPLALIVLTLLIAGSAIAVEGWLFRFFLGL
jgi:hypothetical protein